MQGGGGGGELNMMQIKSNTWRYLLFELILRVLSYSWIHPFQPHLVLGVSGSLTLIDCLLEFESKEIATLTDKNFLTFISGKHSQHNARKCADRLTQKGNSERHWHPSRLGRYYFDRVVREEVWPSIMSLGLGVWCEKMLLVQIPGLCLVSPSSSLKMRGK